MIYTYGENGRRKNVSGAWREIGGKKIFSAVHRSELTGSRSRWRPRIRLG